MNKLEFFIAIKPPTITHQQKRIKMVNGKPLVYESDELKDARNKLSAYLSKHVPNEKFTGAIRLITKWCYPITKGHENGQYKITKPDTDNMIKLLKDVMTDLGFWKDDAQVASEITEKFWSDVPGIFIKVENLN